VSTDHEPKHRLPWHRRPRYPLSPQEGPSLQVYLMVLAVTVSLVWGGFNAMTGAIPNSSRWVGALALLAGILLIAAVIAYLLGPATRRRPAEASFDDSLRGLARWVRSRLHRP
jgi:hypothetical protein